MAAFLPSPKPRFRPDFSLATVNIVLLLLLYFLVAGDPAEVEERAITPPTVQDLPLEGLPRPLVSMQPGGGLALNGVVTNRDALRERISSGEFPRVHLLAAQDHSARAVLNLSGVLSAAGAEVQMVTLRRESGSGGGGGGS